MESGARLRGGQLETRFLTLEDEEGNQIRLAGLLHFGDQDHYRQVAEWLGKCDAVFLEGVGGIGPIWDRLAEHLDLQTTDALRDLLPDQIARRVDMDWVQLSPLLSRSELEHVRSFQGQLQDADFVRRYTRTSVAALVTRPRDVDSMVIVATRNEFVLREARAQFARSRSPFRLGLAYGVGHQDGLREGLEGSGFKITSESWIAVFRFTEERPNDPR